MNFCCHELEQLEEKISADDLDCITLHREFNMVVLEAAVLRTALVAMKNVKKTSWKEPCHSHIILANALAVNQ